MNPTITSVKLSKKHCGHFYREALFSYPAFCDSAVNELFPSTKDASDVLFEISRKAFAGSKRFVIEYEAAIRVEGYFLVSPTYSWFVKNNFGLGPVYIKFSPTTATLP